MSIKPAIPTADEYLTKKVSDWTWVEMDWTFHVAIKK
jgi:hypothetical protein